MASGRVGKHIRAIAERRDHQFRAVRRLDAQRRAEAPAEATGRAEAVIGAGLGARAVFDAQRIFVDDHGVTERLADRPAQEFRRDRALWLYRTSGERL